MSEEVPGFDARVFGLSAVEFQVVAGNAFGTQFFDPALANDANLDMLLRTGAQAVAARVRGFAGGDGTGEVFEGPTLSADGTPLLAVNRNLVKATSKGPALSSIFGGPTVTDPGSGLSEGFFIPGGTGGNSTGGASAEALIIFAPSTDYLLRITNISGVASPFQISLLFVEGKMSERAAASTRDMII